MSRQTSIYESVMGEPLLDMRALPMHAYNVLTDQQLSREAFFEQDRELFAKMLVRQGHDPQAHGFAMPETPLTRTEGERVGLIRELVEVQQVEKSPDIISPFFDWPAYAYIMETFGTRLQNGGRALMLGAQTPLTARTFEALATEEYGADEVHIVDVVSGDDKRRFGTFTYADARALPFADNSFDIIQTSELFNYATDRRGVPINPNEAMGDILPEAMRALRAGGQLLMRESVRLNDPSRPIDSVEAAKRVLQRDQEYYITALDRAGAEQVVILPFAKPPDLMHLFDPRQRRGVAGWRPLIGSYAIHATKA